MKKFVIAVLFCLLAVGAWVALHAPAPQPKEASVLDRVEKSGVIRCGYWIYEPYISKDPNTGKMSGITVDYFEQTAAKAGKKIVWESEVPFDQIKPALDYNRIDLFCVPCSAGPDFRKALDFAGSFGSMPYYLYVAKDKQLSKEQLETASFAFVDGFLTSVKTPEYFPRAKYVSLPQMTSPADLYNYLKFGKTDVILNEHVSALDYMKNNPDAIRRYSDEPVFSVDMTFPLKKGDATWGAFVQQMTDTTLPENRDIFLKLLEKYGLSQDMLHP